MLLSVVFSFLTSTSIMRRIVKFTFVALLLLNSILQIASFPGFLLLRGERNDDSDDPEKKFIELANRLAEDDQLMAYSIIILSTSVERYSCIEDEEIRKMAGGDMYNSITNLYPYVQSQYQKLLAKLDKADQVVLKMTVGAAKKSSFERCKSIFGL